MHKLHLCYACAIAAASLRQAAEQQRHASIDGRRGRPALPRAQEGKELDARAQGVDVLRLRAGVSQSNETGQPGPKPKHAESIALSIGAFEAYTSPSCDPYGSLLHKAWSRCAETDARSTTKAIYVLHRLASSPACCGEKEFAGLANAYRELCSQSRRNSRALFRPESRAEDARAPKDVSYSTKKWRKFLEILRLRRRLLALRGLGTAGIRARARGFDWTSAARGGDDARAAGAAARESARRGRRAARLQADARGYAAALLVAALAWGNASAARRRRHSSRRAAAR